MKATTSNEYDNPDWSAGGRVHNWRNYINDGLMAIWHTFTSDQKRVIYENAEQQAEREEWV